MSHPAPRPFRPALPMLTTALPLLLAASVWGAPAAAQDKRADIAPADIEAATYSGTGELPSGQSALTAKVQILLDRAGVSPGVVDGFRGGMSESAIKAFERKNGLPQDGRLDAQVWALLEQYAVGPLTSTYTVTAEDAQGLVDSIPTDYAEKAKMSSMGYTSVTEKLAERFHMDDKFLAQLNKGVEIAPGATINVTVPAKPIKAKVARIVVDKATGRVAAYDGNGGMVADYPATVGSDATPSPHGSHLVEAVALDPDYTYNPKINFKQGDNDKVLKVPPGPNGPVGNVWIDLSQPTYGIHGTPTPSKLFVNESNGCVRLTNWDARELAGMVQPGLTIVDFLAPGVAIADVTKPVEPAAVAAGATAGATAEAAAGAAMGEVTGSGMGTAPILRAGRPVARRMPGATGAASAPVATMATAPAAEVQATTTADVTGAAQPAAAAPTADTGAAPVAAAPGVPAADPLAAALDQATGGAVGAQPYVLPTSQPGAAPAPAGN